MKTVKELFKKRKWTITIRTNGDRNFLVVTNENDVMDYPIIYSQFADRIAYDNPFLIPKDVKAFFTPKKRLSIYRELQSLNGCH